MKTRSFDPVEDQFAQALLKTNYFVSIHVMIISMCLLSFFSDFTEPDSMLIIVGSGAGITVGMMNIIFTIKIQTSVKRLIAKRVRASSSNPLFFTY